MDGSGTKRSIRGVLLDGLIAAVEVSPGVGWILQHPEDAALGEASPDQFAIPSTAIGALRKSA